MIQIGWENFDLQKSLIHDRIHARTHTTLMHRKLIQVIFGGKYAKRTNSHGFIFGFIYTKRQMHRKAIQLIFG